MEVYIFALLISVIFGKPAKFRDPMINEGLFEGDILITDYQFMNAVPLESQKWPNGVVPYVISPELQESKPLYLRAMQHLERFTCLCFVERTKESDYILIYHDDGCFAEWGRKGGRQLLSLGDDCDQMPVVLHELLHAIGLEHEHNRSDRDDYVTINWENIQKEYFYAFKKLRPDQNRLLTRFDYNSIMLYGSTFFAKEPESDKYSMVRKDGSYIQNIKNRTAISDLDIAKVNILYDCFYY